MYMTDILVNDFMFCEAHGAELCHYCGVDHRMVNNIRVEDETQTDPRLDPDSDNYEPVDLDDRRSFNAYELGAVLHTSARNPADAQYKCSLHETVDCPTCFDWVALIKVEIGALMEQDAKVWQLLKMRKAADP